MTVSEILKGSDYALTIFTAKEVAALTIFERAGKPYLTCAATDKARPAKPEEIVRQLYLRKLMDGYGYPKERIAVEKPVWFGSAVHEKAADIVVWEKDALTTPYIIVEVKKPRRKDGLEQLKSYCNAEGSPIGVWTNGAETIHLHREEPNLFRNLPDIPDETQRLADLLAERWTIEDLEANNKLVTERTSLRDVIRNMEDLVLANAGVDAFEEVFKLIYAKLYDEWQAARGGIARRYLDFRVGLSTAREFSETVDKLFKRAQHERVLDRLPCVTLGSLGLVTDGIHASPDVVEEDGMCYLSAKCVKDNEFSLGDTLQISRKQDTENVRTRLREGDLLLTTVGTIGNAAVVQPELLPANIDRHLGLIRVRPDAPVDPYFAATFLNSALGRFQSLREATGNVQLNLFIEKIKTLKIPLLPIAAKISQSTRQAYRLRRNALQLITSAEQQLAAAVGLARLDRSPSLFYERNFIELQAARRFDAEYFSPRFQAVFDVLAKDGRAIHDVAELIERHFRPERRESGDTFQYIEIGNVRADGTAGSETVEIADAPSRAQWIVEPGDIITSTVRPIRRLSAIVLPEQSGFVCSSGFAVLRPKEGVIEPEVLLTYLRLPIICELLDLHTTASMYPAISTTRLMQIPIAVPKPSARKEIVVKVRESLTARAAAARLLEEAKAEVESLVLGSGK